MSPSHEAFLVKLGFRFGLSGPHAARTMMLDDLQALFAHLPADAERAAYAEQVISLNALGKPTKKARELSLRHLTALYSLDPKLSIFRALRRLWDVDPAAQPTLALLASLARDPLLKRTQAFILSRPSGSVVTRADWEAQLANDHQDRFSPASLQSFAQNVAGTWTAAGFLTGKKRKFRSIPTLSPVTVVFALFLGHLEGLSGQRLFASEWMNLLPDTPAELEALANSASHRGLLVFLNGGGVKEVRFPDFLTQAEEQIRLEGAHVI